MKNIDSLIKCNHKEKCSSTKQLFCFGDYKVCVYWKMFEKMEWERQAVQIEQKPKDLNCSIGLDCETFGEIPLCSNGNYNRCEAFYYKNILKKRRMNEK